MAKQVNKTVVSPRSAAKTVKCGTVSKTTATKNVESADGFPTAILDKWVTGRTQWNHDDWKGLVNTLRTKGYDGVVNQSEGIEKVGQFLEERRAERQIPKAELDAWVSRHPSWDHGDWLVLLGDLRDCGYAALADSPHGQRVIGRYIETRRDEIHRSTNPSAK